jgi:xanthine dehydrogenase accessory factor
MLGMDHEVVRAAADWLGQGRAVVLVTVARTWGSSPRPPGSLLALRDDGAHVGSVSGGCVEADLIERVRARTLATARPQIIRYGVSRAQAQDFGLPCGGTLELIAEELREPAAWHALIETLDARRLAVRRVNVLTGRASIAPAGAEVDFFYDGLCMSKTFGPAWQLLVIGASAPARYLAQIAQSLDYRVMICDPRAEVTATWDVPGTELLAGMPDDVVRERVRDARCAVVALTHDPKLDDMALLEALISPAFFVGALGSQANNTRRRERLAQLGVPADALARLRAPVGLAIGSRTPPEIAVSVLAELTAVRHGVAVLSAAPSTGVLA